MKIVQAVTGVFHHFELAYEMRRRGHLQKIYTTWPWARVKREGLPRALVGTFPWINLPDYILDRQPFYPPPVSRLMKRLNPIAFDAWTRRDIPACDALIAISGAALQTGRLVQQRGGLYLCDRGSTHQRNMDEVLAQEHTRWGLEAPAPNPWITRREEACYDAADVITVPSTVARRSFLERGFAAEKIRVIPYGVRLDRFQPTAQPPHDSFEVLFAGQVRLRKGIPYLLEAFARLRHPNKRLTIVGAVQPRMRPLLERLSTEHVTFTGSLPQAQLIDRMSRSHVLVLPSIEEGMAQVQAQSLACECPVIATVATGAEDLFTHGVEGFIVPDRDVNSLAGRMQQLADDAALRNRMGAAGRSLMQAIGGWYEYGDRWESLLHELTRKA